MGSTDDFKNSNMENESKELDLIKDDECFSIQKDDNEAGRSFFFVGDDFNDETSIRKRQIKLKLMQSRNEERIRKLVKKKKNIPHEFSVENNVEIDASKKSLWDNSISSKN